MVTKTPAKPAATAKPKTKSKKSPAANAAGLRALKKAAKGSPKETNHNFRKINYKTLLPLGCPILNLLFSGRPHGALPQGQMIRGFGESGSGKSFIMCTALAEATLSEFYKDYRLIYDDAEGGAQFNTSSLFGDEFDRRVEWESSETVEECYCRIKDAFDAGPCIYIIDSIDALTSKQEKEKFNVLRKSRRKAEADGTEAELKGEMTDGKAKANSKYLRQIRKAMAAHGSILIMISQVRDVMNSPVPGMKSTSGGKSVKFYAASEFSVTKRGSIIRPVAGADREVGIMSEIKIIKNRMYGTTGGLRLPILHSTGIDFTGASLDWLCAEKVIIARQKDEKKAGGNPTIVKSPLNKVDMKREALIRLIESKPELMEKMNGMIFDRWQLIREGIKKATPRTSRYRPATTPEQ